MQLSSQNSPQRPFWSVMIPTYKPRADYLEKALRSVLDQDPGPHQMQIEVVDDCSPSGETEAIASSIGGERVRFSRTPKNLGLSGCWNTCIERSLGQWVHILHQDDYVLNSFYSALGQGLVRSDSVAAAFSRFAVCDEDGHWSSVSGLHRREPGILENWLEKLGAQQLIQTPSIVVRRSAYEAVGGFRSDLCYTLDWEMWLRIAKSFSFWFDPRILACYRTHQSSTTSRLVREAADVRDIRKMIDITGCHQEPGFAPKTCRRARRRYADFAVVNARQLLVAGYTQSAWKQLWEGFRLSRAPHVWGGGAAFVYLFARVLGARCNRRIKSYFNVP